MLAGARVAAERLALHMLCGTASWQHYTSQRATRLSADLHRSKGTDHGTWHLPCVLPKKGGASAALERKEKATPR